jgi:hypothetical protein
MWSFFVKNLYLFFAITTLFFQTPIFGDEPSSSTETSSVSIENPVISEVTPEPAPTVEPSIEVPVSVQTTEEVSSTQEAVPAQEAQEESTALSDVVKETDSAITATETAATTTITEEPIEEGSSTASSIEKVETTSSENLSSVYNHAGRVDVKTSWDLFVAGSYLYWQPREEGLGLGFVYPATASEERTVYNMDFDYHSGFKIGLGTNFNHDNWIAYLDYTYLHAKDHRFVSTPEGASFLTPFWNYGEDSAISATWKLSYDMIDLKLSRPFYESCKIIASSFLGMKGGWIKQRYIFNELAGIWYCGSTHSNSWLIGPQVGINTNYFIGAGFRLFGNADASLLYQHSKTKVLVPYTGSSESNSNERDYTNQITPNVDLDMGLAWGTYFDNHNWHFDLSASYEFQYYWSQNFMKHLYDTTINLAHFSEPHGVGKIKDLMFHGLTITARFDF